MEVNEKSIGEFLDRWQDILRLRDWDIRIVVVRKKWRKSGDIKIDRCNRMAALMINHNLDPVHLEEVVIHELLHLKLYGMDQMIEEYLIALFGSDEKDPKRNFAYDQFMLELESTTEDLTKALLSASGDERVLYFKGVQKQVDEEIGPD